MSRHLWPIPLVGVHESSFGRFLVERRRDRPTHDRQKGGPLSTPTEPKAPAKQTLDEMVASRTAAKLPAAPVFRAGGRDGRARRGEGPEGRDRARGRGPGERAGRDRGAARSRSPSAARSRRSRPRAPRPRSSSPRSGGRCRGALRARAARRAGALPRDPGGATAPGHAGRRRSRPAVGRRRRRRKRRRRFSPELRTLQTELAEREQLGEAHRQRLLEALRERDAARLELQRVSDARLHAERRLEKITEVLHRATSNGGPRPAGGDGVEEQHVRELRDELAIAIARAKSAEARTNELRDEIESVRDAAHDHERHARGHPPRPRPGPRGAVGPARPGARASRPQQRTSRLDRGGRGGRGAGPRHRARGRRGRGRVRSRPSSGSPS